MAWLEQQLTEHGPLSWATLAEAMAGEPWQEQARAWVDAADPDEEQGFEDLLRVMQRLWIAHLGEQAQQIAAGGGTDAEGLARLRALHEQIARLKSTLASPAR